MTVNTNHTLRRREKSDSLVNNKASGLPNTYTTAAIASTKISALMLTIIVAYIGAKNVTIEGGVDRDRATRNGDKISLHVGRGTASFSDF